jgi:hypothetical protein
MTSLVTATLLVLATPAFAQQSDAAATASAAAARSLAKDAKEAFDAGDWAKAADLYHRAAEVMPAPTLVIREARAIDKLGHLIAASELLVKVSRWPLEASSPAAFRTAAQEATAELADIRARIPGLKLMVEGDPPSEIVLDGLAVQRALMNVHQPVDPGDHAITGTIVGRPILEQHVHLAEGERLELVLHPASPAASTAPRDTPATSPPVVAPGNEHPGTLQRTLGWGSIGVGAAGIVVGVVTGAVASGKKSDLDAACPGNTCPRASENDLDSFRSLRTISTVGWITGFVGLGAGVVLLLTAPRSTVTASAVSPWMNARSTGIGGTF